MEDIRGMLDALGIDRAHICGLSMGGYATLHFGIRYPERALSLVVAGAGYGSVPGERERFQKDVEETARRFLDDGIVAVADFYTKGPTRVQLMDKDPKGWQELYDQFVAQSARGHALTMQGVQMTRPSVYELERELERLEVPTLIMTGDEDEPCLEPGALPEAEDPVFGAPGAPADRSRHQSRGARRLQSRRARLPHRGGRRPLGAAQSPVGVRLGHPSARSRSPEMTLPLSPYTVIDLTRARSGPTAVRQLADMGARGHPDLRARGRGGRFPRRGFDSQNLHRNKRSLTLDLKSPRGIDILKRLIAKADVVVENFRPDVKTRLGIDYETLSRAQPAAHLRQHLGLRPDGAVSRPTGL